MNTLKYLRKMRFVHAPLLKNAKYHQILYDTRKSPNVNPEYIDLVQPDKNGDVPILKAAREKDIPAIKDILKKLPSAIDHSDYSGASPLVKASKEGDAETVKVLLEHGANVDKGTYTGDTPLTIVSMKGHVDVAKVLLENGANVNHTTMNNMTPLGFAANQNEANMTRCLLENGANVKKPNGTYSKTALQIAKEKGYIQVANIIKEYTKKIDCEMEL